MFVIFLVSSSPYVSPARFSDSMWARQHLPVCFLHLLGGLEDHARRGVLPHFFVPNYTLFSPDVVPRKTLAFLVNALEEQRREGLPLLKPPAPVLPLRLMSPSIDTSSEISADQSSILTPDSAFMNILVVVFAVALVCVLFRM